MQTRLNPLHLLRRLTLLTAFGLMTNMGLAAPVVVTPGSLAGYVFYPPAAAAPGGTGTGGTANTFMTCFATPTTSDTTVNFATRDWVSPDTSIKVVAIMNGGGAGAGNNGGGGGSSAILINGTPVVVAPGADAGMTRAKQVAMGFTIKNTDIVRFVTGGAGGQGAHTYVGGLGGGGGGGYMSGGNGGQRTAAGDSAGYSVANGAIMGGKGGSSTPGAGGCASASSMCAASGPGGSGSSPGSVGSPYDTLNNGYKEGAPDGYTMYYYAEKHPRAGAAKGLAQYNYEEAMYAPYGATYKTFAWSVLLSDPYNQIPPGNVNYCGAKATRITTLNCSSAQFDPVTNSTDFALAPKSGTIGNAGQIILSYQATACGVIPNVVY